MRSGVTVTICHSEERSNQESGVGWTTNPEIPPYGRNDRLRLGCPALSYTWAKPYMLRKTQKA